jgi:hypothetical protein
LLIAGRNEEEVKLINLKGRTFGHWKVLYKSTRRSKSHHPYWTCVCQCGFESDVEGGSLIRGDSLSCGCKFGLRPYEGLYNILLRKNNGRGEPLPVLFSYEDFLVFTGTKGCHYCGGSINWTEYNVVKSGTQAYNLDRKDPEVGYSLENCVVCCPRCNRAKSNHFTYEEWVQIGALIKSWNQTIRRI